MHPLWLKLLELLRTKSADEDPQTDEHEDAEPADTDLPEVVEAAEPRSDIVVGAWTGFGSMAKDSDISRDVKFAKWIGLRRLDLMVNDHSGARRPRAFDTYSKSRIVALAKAAADAGLEVHLTSWIMPHATYLRQARDQLLELGETTDARSILFDAEEPWTQAVLGLPYEEAAAMVANLFGEYGVTGIGYASASKLGALVRGSACMVPQCYATTSSGLDPATAAPKLSQRWRQTFGDRPLVVGLAAYRQNGIGSYTPEEAMTTSFQAAKTTGASALVYWSMRQIRSSLKIANVLRKLTGAA